jgi:hypothetical protein
MTAAMPSFLQKRRAATPLLVVLAALAGCVDVTPPWEKVAARGAGSAGTGGALAIDGAGPAGGVTGSGGTMGMGLGGAGGVGGTSEVPMGGGGAIDAGPGGASGGMGGTGIDAPLPGTGGSLITLDGGGDVPLSGSGGIAGVGGAHGTGGISANGVTGTGGSNGTGGARGTGGTGGNGTGDVTTPDAGPEVKADAQPDTDPLLAGLVVYYTCEDANGIALADDSGNGYAGTLGIGLLPDGGTPTGAGYELVPGKVGNGLALHKAGLGYVDVPAVVFADATDLTIALWVNVTTVQSWSRILDVGVTPATYQYVNPSRGTKYLNLLPKNGDSSLVFAITTDGYSNEQRLTAPSLPANTWTHLVVVLASGGGGRLYLNGAEVDANSSLTLRPVDLGAIDYAFIGKSRFDADPSFDGVIDGFRVYNRALSAAEVTALYNFTMGP